MKTTNYQQFVNQIENKLKSTRTGIGVTLRQFSAEDLAIITLNQVDQYLMTDEDDEDDNGVQGTLNLTNVAVPIGRSILMKIEDKSLGLKLNINRFKAGVFLLDCLASCKVLELITSELHSFQGPKVFRTEFNRDRETGKVIPSRKLLNIKKNYTTKKGVVVTALEQAERASKRLNARQPKMLKITDWESLNRMLLIVPLHAKDIFDPTLPQFEKPQDWTRFYHPEGMELVRRCNEDIISEFTADKMPIFFEGINKQQGTPMKLNLDLLAIFDSLDVEGIIALFGKNYTDKQYVSVERSIVRATKVAKMIGDRTFYSVMFTDFRGRFYYAMKHLNYSSNKFCKSLFLIDEESPVDLDMLKIYAAGLYKYDKVLRRERVAKFDEHEADFMKWLDNPSKYTKELGKSEDAHSLLAALSLYKQATAPNAGEVLSGLPICQDDKCSGLQHLTISSRDETTAPLCGLNSGEHTADYYEYLRDNTPLFTEHPYWYARLAPEFKSRKTAKTSGMIYPYSAGAKCMGTTVYDDRKNDEGYEDLTRKIANEMGEALFNTCETKMPGIAKTMSEFKARALEAYEAGEQWGFTAPTGFIMKQNYYKMATEQVKVTFQGKVIKPRVIMGRTDIIDKDAVLLGAAANGTHTLDAAKLCFTVVYCDFYIIVIHDSFATIMMNTSALYDNVRGATVDMYTNYSVVEAANLNIELGGLDINNILTSEWFCTY